jgi:PST family polysaccharide transporter
MSATPAASSFRWSRALGLGSVHSLVRLALSFLTIKVTAVYLGPAGLALVAQLANFIGFCHGALGNTIGSATARLYPEYRDDPVKRRRLLATAWRLAGTLLVPAALLIVLAAAPLARWLLDSDAHAVAVAIGAAAAVCLVLAHVIICALDGAGELGRVVACASLSAVAGFAVYVPACVLWGIPGGLIGYALSQILALPVSYALLRGSPGVAPADFRAAFDPVLARRILAFMPMLVVHSAMQPLGLILIRDSVAAQLGLESAGLWQAAWRLSEVYLGVVMASLSLYFLPRLGEVAGTPALRPEILRTLARVVGLTAAVALAIFLLRDLVVRLVFTREFLEVRALMPVQLAGDVLRIGGWTLGFVLVALVRSRWYIALELMMPALYFAGTLAFVPEYGMRGVPIAYCIASAAHLGVSLFALRDILFRHENAPHRPAGR